MTDTEILDAIIKYGMWVHPSSRFPSETGWTADASNEHPLAFAWDYPTLRAAVTHVVTVINASREDRHDTA